jgi:WD40 repeat protein
MRVLFLFLFAVFLFGKDIAFDGYISKVAISNKYLVAGLENGVIYIDNFHNLKKIAKINLPKIKDFMGDEMSMPIYSIDVLGDNVLILAEGEDAVREFFIYNIKNKHLKKIWQSKKTYMQARYIDKNRILFALLSDEIALYDIKSNKFIYTKQVGHYAFSAFALNKNKTKVAIGDESGGVKIVDVQTGKILDSFSNFNKNKTISLAFIKNLVLNASSDRRVSITNIKNNTLLLKLNTKFLPYGAAISPNEKYFALQYDEQNDIAVFDMNKNLVVLLKGQTMPLNGLKFLNNDTIFSFSAAKIMINKIK